MESEDVAFVQQTLIKCLLYFRLSRPRPAGNKDSCAWSLRLSRIVHRMPFKEHSQKGLGGQGLAGFFEQKGGIKGIVSHRLVRLEFVAESH